MKPVLSLLSMTLLFSGSALAATDQYLPKEADTLMNKSANIDRYRAEFTLEAKEDNGEVIQLEGELLFERPNKRRLSLRVVGDEEISQVVVSDGKTEWQYYPDSQVVYRTENPPEIPGPHRPFAEAESASVKFIDQIGVGPDTKFRFEGVPIPSVVYGSPVQVETLRVDINENSGMVKELALLDKAGEKVFRQEFKKVEIEPNFIDAELTFTPPEGVAVIDVEQSNPVVREQD